MSKLPQRDLREIVGSKVEMLMITGSVLSLKLDDHASFELLLGRLFWRITGKEGILLCSDDFYEKIRDGIERFPIFDDEYDRYEKEHEGDLVTVTLYDYLDEVFYERKEALRSLLEKTTVLHAEEGKLGDLKLSFSTDVTLEVYSCVDHDHSEMPLYHFLKTMP